MCNVTERGARLVAHRYRPPDQNGSLFLNKCEKESTHTVKYGGADKLAIIGLVMKSLLVP